MNYLPSMQKRKIVVYYQSHFILSTTITFNFFNNMDINNLLHRLTTLKEYKKYAAARIFPL